MVFNYEEEHDFMWAVGQMRAGCKVQRVDINSWYATIEENRIVFYRTDGTNTKTVSQALELEDIEAIWMLYEEKCPHCGRPI